MHCQWSQIHPDIVNTRNIGVWKLYDGKVLGTWWVKAKEVMKDNKVGGKNRVQTWVMRGGWYKREGVEVKIDQNDNWSTFSARYILHRVSFLTNGVTALAVMHMFRFNKETSILPLLEYTTWCRSDWIKSCYWHVVHPIISRFYTFCGRPPRWFYGTDHLATRLWTCSAFSNVYLKMNQLY